MAATTPWWTGMPSGRGPGRGRARQAGIIEPLQRGSSPSANTPAITPQWKWTANQRSQINEVRLD